MKQLGAHILISSHVATFLDGLVDKVVFLDKGLLVFESRENADIETAYKRLFMATQQTKPLRQNSQEISGA